MTKVTANNSKTTKVEEIPESWSFKKIKEVCETYSGGTPSRRQGRFFKGEIPWIKSSEVRSGLIYDSEERISQEGLESSSAKWVPSESTLVAMYGATAGEVGLLRIPATTNQAVVALLPKKNLIDSMFLYQCILFQKNKLTRLVQGSGQPNLTQSIVRDFKIPIPPFEEQREIGSILFSMDEMIIVEKKQEEILSQLKKAMMLYLLTRGIGHTRFKQTKIGPKEFILPEKWQIKPARELFYIKGRIGWRGLKKADFTDRGPYLITGVDFTDGKIDWKSSFHIPIDKYLESPEIFVKENDVILTKDGTIGKIALIDEIPGGKASLNSHLLLIRGLRKGEILSKFIFYVLQSKYFSYYVDVNKVGGTRPGLSQSAFEKFPFPIPPKDEQMKIITVLSNIDKLSNKEKRELENLEQMKKGLMQILLTGKVRVKV